MFIKLTLRKAFKEVSTIFGQNHSHALDQLPLLFAHVCICVFYVGRGQFDNALEYEHLFCHTEYKRSSVLSTSHSTLHLQSNPQKQKMNRLGLALFSTLLAFSNASNWEAGPCPPKPEVIAPFEVERVRMAG